MGFCTTLHTRQNVHTNKVNVLCNFAIYVCSKHVQIIFTILSRETIVETSQDLSMKSERFVENFISTLPKCQCAPHACESSMVRHLLISLWSALQLSLFNHHTFQVFVISYPHRQCATDVLTIYDTLINIFFGNK